MTKQDMIDSLLYGINQANEENRNTVIISAGTASEILALLIGNQDKPQPLMTEEGEVLFYCADCGQSFRAVPREDPECFSRWHYHRWLANCPRCKTEVMQNDRYWR